ncbi:MAG: hypothetical protein HYR72_20230 [Deltaproteobacteria bacterium]|nr:hypothetical protein [Deltaproteobacteria bacterium]MBI3389418.1 hypothetical protein [Deltaproteobacteria bacterium]
MEPIVLIHGYSAESKESTPAAIAKIYGTLPEALRAAYGSEAVVEIDLSRYVSLEDGVTLDDISRALDRALTTDFAHLVPGPFHVITHSTGALVIRNWIRMAGRKPSPIRNLIHLAGAHLGSGWAHIGKGQLAKWARMVFQAGAERGVQVLDALEFGSDRTLDLHLHFLHSETAMASVYGVREYSIVGSQPAVEWYPIPIRYAKEDGSDGVVRVAASNLNMHYLRFGPTAAALALAWKDASGELGKHLRRRGARQSLYELKDSSLPGEGERPEIPFAIPYECAHTGKDLGIVVGTHPRDQVLRLVRQALETPAAEWSSRVADFRTELDATYQKVLTQQAPSWWKKWIEEPRAQYDRHAQLIFRIRDQDGRPVLHHDIFLDSVQGKGDPSLPVGSLFEDKHVNETSPHIIAFYLRADAFSASDETWVPRIPQVNGCFFEVTATEPETDEVLYLPMRFEFSKDDLIGWVRGHRTTIVDVELLRLPSPNVYRMVRFAG